MPWRYATRLAPADEPLADDRRKESGRDLDSRRGRAGLLHLAGVALASPRLQQQGDGRLRVPPVGRAARAGGAPFAALVDAVLPERLELRPALFARAVPGPGAGVLVLVRPAHLGQARER